MTEGTVEPQSAIDRARLKAGLTQAQFARLLGVSRRRLEQWEQRRRRPSGAGKTLVGGAELHPEVLRELGA
jgi:putative transcriptional regulator